MVRRKDGEDCDKSVLNTQIFGKVAVLAGGRSAERKISLQSGELVLSALLKAGVDAQTFDPAERLLSDLRTENFDRVFNALHGGYGENGQLQGALEFYGIPYTGSGVLGSALSMDKFRTKLIWQQTGVPTAPFEIIVRGDNYEKRADEVARTLGLPLFVKPSSEGSSIAVIKIKIMDDLVSAIMEVAKLDKVILVEKAIEGGGEYSCCIAGKLDLPLIKIVPCGEFYDYHSKYVAEDTQYLIPCGLSASVEAQVKQLARRAFDVLGCSSWGRADLVIDKGGNPYFLELNTAPGMTCHSLPAKAAKHIGLSFEDISLEVLSLTL